MNLARLAAQPFASYHAGIQLWEHLRERVASAITKGNSRREQIETPEDLARYGEEFRQKFLNILGGLPVSPTAIPETKVTGHLETSLLEIKKLAIESRPGVLVSALLYLPAQRTEKLPAILFLCGHGSEGKAEPRYQAICQQLASQGFAVLIMDFPGQGERWNYLDPSTGKPLTSSPIEDHEYCGAKCQMLGRNLSRFFLHDAIRAVDYLSAHPAIDPKRIGITGSSGGGTQTLLMMLLEPRLAAAAPATCVTSRLSIFASGYAQDSEQIWHGFTAAGYDFADFLAAFAPKPLCVLSVTYDFFPIEGTRDAVSRVRRFWELLGVADRFSTEEDRSVHCYTDPLCERAGAFFRRHLNPGSEPCQAEVELFPAQSLQCFPCGSSQASHPHPKTIGDEIRTDFAPLKSARNIETARVFLRERIFQNRAQTPPNLRIVEEQVMGDLRCQTGFWWSQKDIINSGVLLTPSSQGPSKFPLTLAIWSGGTSTLDQHSQWIRHEAAKGRAIFVLNLTGMGPLAPLPINAHTPHLSDNFGTLFRLADDLFSLGDSLAALRTFDLLQAIETLPSWKDPGTPEDLALYGHGREGIYGALAAAVDPRLRLQAWENPLSPYDQILTSEFYDDREIKSFLIPGLVRHADWPELISPLPAFPAHVPAH